MLVPLLALVAGILCAMQGIGALAGGISIICGCIVFLLLGLLSDDPLKAFRLRRWQPVWIVLWFAGIGVIDYDLRRPYESVTVDSGERFLVYGRILEITNSTSGDRCVVDVHRLQSAGGVCRVVRNMRVMVYSDAVGEGVDDEVLFPAEFARVDGDKDFFNRGYVRHLVSKGILYRCDVVGKDFRHVRHKRTPGGVAGKLRDSLAGFMENTPLAKNTQSFLIAILLGDRAYMDKETRSAFADAGISHVLALSGMHIGMIAALLMVVLFPLNFKGWYRQRMLIVGILLLGYAFVTGFGHSTVRACIMAWCMILCLWLERRNSAWNALLLSVFIILLFDPFAVADTGLGLSFLCVASLIFFASPLNTVDRHVHPVLYKINGAVICTLVATFGSWTLTAYAFGTFPPAFIVANLAVLPLLPLYLGMAVLYFVLTVLGLSPDWFAGFLDSGYAALENFVVWLNSGTGGSLHVEVPAWVLVSWIVGMAFLAVALHGHKPRWLTAAGSACMVLSIFAISFYTPSADRYFINSHGRTPSLQALVSGKVKRMPFMAGKASGYDVGNVRIVSLDCNLDGFLPSAPYVCDHLVLTKSFTGSLKMLDGRIKPASILLYPTMSRKREAILQSEADSLGIPCRSLRATQFEIDCR